MPIRLFLFTSSLRFSYPFIVFLTHWLPCQTHTPNINKSPQAPSDACSQRWSPCPKKIILNGPVTIRCMHPTLECCVGPLVSFWILLWAINVSISILVLCTCVGTCCNVWNICNNNKHFYKYVKIMKIKVLNNYYCQNTVLCLLGR